MANIKRFLALPTAFALLALALVSPVSAQTIPMLSVTAYTQIQTVVPRGADNANFATITLDARNSSEDIEVRSLPIRLVAGAGADVGDLDNCQAYNAADMDSALNTGDNVDDLSAGDNTLTFNNPLTVEEGTITTLWIQCDVAADAALGETFQVNVMPITSIEATSVDSDEDLVFPTSSVVGTGSVIAIGDVGSVIIPPPVVVTPTFPNTGNGGDAAGNVAVIALSLAVLALGVVGIKKYAR